MNSKRSHSEMQDSSRNDDANRQVRENMYFLIEQQYADYSDLRSNRSEDVHNDLSNNGSHDEQGNVNSEARNVQTLRCVKPYLHEYKTWCKQRWIGRSLFNVMVDEFGNNHQNYYLNAIKLGLLYVSYIPNPQHVNSKRPAESFIPTSPDYILKDGDVTTHITHFHEPPVKYTSAEEMIVFEDQYIIVVNKPASIPVHPCGAYRENSLINILANESSFKELKTVHRIDRLTSGLVIFGKNVAAANAVIKHLIKKSSNGLRGRGNGDENDEEDAREMRKIYLARVHGNFSDLKKQLSGQPALFPDDCLRFQTADELDEVKRKLDKSFIDSCLEECFLSWPLRCVNKKPCEHDCVSRDDIAAFKSSKLDENVETTFKAKDAISRFRFLKYIPEINCSIVEAEPLTGRTHQLRLHLRFLGYPITNDPNYGIDGNVAQQQNKQRIEEFGPPMTGKPVDLSTFLDEELASKTVNEKAAMICRYCTEGGAEAAFRSLQLRWQGMDLHAYYYKFPKVDLDVVDSYCLEGDAEATKFYSITAPIPAFAVV